LKLHVRESRPKPKPNKPLSRSLRNRIRHSWKPQPRMRPLREPLRSNNRRRKLFLKLQSKRGLRLLPMLELIRNKLLELRPRPLLMSMRKPARRLSNSQRRRWNPKPRSR